MNQSVLESASTDISALCAHMAASRCAKLDDVLTMRRVIYAKSLISEQDATLVLSLDDSLVDVDPSWSEFLTEVICDYLVHQQLPEGYVDENKAQWLVRHVSANGFVKSDTELELLIKVIEAARRVPHALTAFALEQVKKAVLDGEGPLARGGLLQKDRVTASEVTLLRRILTAASGEAQIAISKIEAEILFEIHDKTRDANNDPEWQDLFVRSLAQYLMSISLYQPPSFEEAVRREKWLAEQTPHVGGFFSRMISGSMAALSYGHSTSDNGALNIDRNASLAEAGKVTESEALWLIERIMKDGQVSELENRLLDYIQREQPDLHPTLTQMMSSQVA